MNFCLPAAIVEINGSPQWLWIYGDIGKGSATCLYLGSAHHHLLLRQPQCQHGVGSPFATKENANATTRTKET